MGGSYESRRDFWNKEVPARYANVRHKKTEFHTPQRWIRKWNNKKQNPPPFYKIADNLYVRDWGNGIELFRPYNGTYLPVGSWEDAWNGGYAPKNLRPEAWTPRELDRAGAELFGGAGPGGTNILDTFKEAVKRYWEERSRYGEVPQYLYDR